MADEADRATDQIENELANALKLIRQNTASNMQNASITKNCIECDDIIPEARGKLGFKLCVTCATEKERRKALFADD